MRLNTRTLGLCLGLLAAFAVPAISATLNENFNGPTINSGLGTWSWSATSSLESGQMVFSSDGNGSADLFTTFQLTGNFTVSVSVDPRNTWDGSAADPIWSSGAGGWLAFQFGKLSAGWGFTSAGYSVYMQDDPTPNAPATVSLSSAYNYPTEIRVTRTGDDWVFDFKTTGGVWTTLLDRQDPLLVGATGANIGLWSYGTVPVDLKIDDLNITADEFIPEPASFGLLLAGGLLLPVMRRLRKRA